MKLSCLEEIAEVRSYIHVRLASLGYDKVFVESIEFPSHNYEGRVHLRAEDDFQSDLPAGLTYESGFMILDLDDIEELLASWPNREQRELRVQARILAQSTANADKLVSIAGREFVAEMQRLGKEVSRMIEDHS